MSKTRWRRERPRWSKRDNADLGHRLRRIDQTNEHEHAEALEAQR